MPYFFQGYYGVSVSLDENDTEDLISPVPHVHIFDVFCVILKISDNSMAMISRSATFIWINGKRFCLTVDICFTGMNQRNVINRNAITDRLTPQLAIRCPVDVTTDLQKTILSACNPLF